MIFVKIVFSRCFSRYMSFLMLRIAVYVLSEGVVMKISRNECKVSVLSFIHNLFIHLVTVTQ